MLKLLSHGLWYLQVFYLSWGGYGLLFKLVNKGPQYQAAAVRNGWSPENLQKCNWHPKLFRKLHYLVDWCAPFEDHLQNWLLPNFLSPLACVTLHTIIIMIKHLRGLIWTEWPPLWSSCQSSWLQIRRPRFDSRHYQKKKVVGSGMGCTSASWVQIRSHLIEK
jgi:hypothetical protein